MTDSSAALGMTDPDTKLKYEHDMMTEKDYYSILNTYRDEGIQEGIAKGKEEGKAEGVKEGQMEEKLRTVKGMVERNMDIDTITALTGLSAERIRSL